MEANIQQLRDALWRNASGAEQTLGFTAMQAYLATGNEISVPYYELVVLAAEYAQSLKLYTRAQTLFRRAVVISNHLGSDPLDARGTLNKISGTPPFPDRLSSERIVISVDTDCHLYGWQAPTISFEPSPPRQYRWYLLAPPAWRQNLNARASEMIEIIFAACNARLAAAEPNDANYIGAHPTAIIDMSPLQLLAEQWQVAATTWSAQRGFVVEDNGLFFPSDPNDFVPMAHLALVTAGLLTVDASIDSLRKIGFSGAILERQREPQKELDAALAYYVGH